MREEEQVIDWCCVPRARITVGGRGLAPSPADTGSANVGCGRDVKATAGAVATGESIRLQDGVCGRAGAGDADAPLA